MTRWCSRSGSATGLRPRPQEAHGRDRPSAPERRMSAQTRRREVSTAAWNADSTASARSLSSAKERSTRASNSA